MLRDTDHNAYLEWLYLEADGDLEPTERAQLQKHLLSCAECRREKEQLPALFDLLSAEGIEPAEDFTERVMTSLPPTGWEARHPRAWPSAALVVLVLSGLSAVLVGMGSGQAPGAGPLTAIVDLFGSAMTAGAGLLSASWQGLGMAVGEVTGGSALQTGVFALFVLGVDVLFLRFLMRSWRPRTVSVRSSEPADE